VRWRGRRQEAGTGGRERKAERWFCRVFAVLAYRHGLRAGLFVFISPSRAVCLQTACLALSHHRFSYVAALVHLLCNTMPVSLSPFGSLMAATVQAQCGLSHLLRTGGGGRKQAISSLLMVPAAFYQAMPVTTIFGVEGGSSWLKSLGRVFLCRRVVVRQYCPLSILQFHQLSYSLLLLIPKAPLRDRLTTVMVTLRQCVMVLNAVCLRCVLL